MIKVIVQPYEGYSVELQHFSTIFLRCVLANKNRPFNVHLFESWAKKIMAFFSIWFSMGVGCFYEELSIGFTAFGAAITACEELGLWRQSLVLLADATTVSAVNAVVLNAAISACGKGAGANETVRDCYFSVGYTHWK